MNSKNTFKFAPLSVGTMRLGDWGAKMNEKEITLFIEGCLELGLNDFDHADIYGGYTTEEDFGKALKNNPSLKNHVNLITKCGIRMISENRPNHQIKSYDGSADHIRSSVENSLKSLSVEKIDLLLIHRPDLLLDPHEVAEEFESLRKAGKVSYFGVSNFTTSQFDLLNSLTPLVTNQVEISLTHLEAFNDGTLDQCIKHQIMPMAWSPLGGGSLFSNPKNEQSERINKVLQTLSEKYNAEADQLLLAWLLKHPSGIIPVLGTSKISRVQDALKAISIDLSREDWYLLLQASTGHEVA